MSPTPEDLIASAKQKQNSKKHQQAIKKNPPLPA
jgi:hypothetical protein